MKPTVYLAGNIAGLSYDKATQWREEITNKIGDLFIVLNPMRDKEQLKGSIVGFTHNSEGCTAKEIFTRDINDIDNSDIIFCFLTSYSIGTAFELGYSWSQNKYIILVTTDELKEHPFLSESVNYITTDFNEGVKHLLEYEQYI